MLVEAPSVLVVLVHHVHWQLAVLGVRAQEYVYVVAVTPGGAPHIAIVVLQAGGPSLAVLACTFTYGARWVLNADTHAVCIHVALRVVARFYLSVGGLHPTAFSVMLNVCRLSARFSPILTRFPQFLM
jgi:hypothetical protein